MKLKAFIRDGAAVLFLSLTACHESEPGETFALFPTNGYRYCFGAWYPSRPPADRTVFDIPEYLVERGTIVSEIGAMGGRVIGGSFNALKVRAILDVDSVPLLYARGVPDDAASFTVEDTLDRSETFIVWIADTLTQADFDQVTEAGAIVQGIYWENHGFGATGNDSLIPIIATWPRVASVETPPRFCPLPAPARTK